MRGALQVIDRIINSTDVWDRNRLTIVELAARIGIRKVRGCGCGWVWEGGGLLFRCCLVFHLV